MTTSHDAAHPPAPAEGKKKEEEKKEEKKKKSLGEKLAMILLSVLFIVIFLYVLNSLLGMGFGASAQVITTTGEGLEANGTAFMRASVGLSILMSGFMGFMLKILIILAIAIGSVIIIQAIIGLLKKKPQGAHP
jgi:hypothetical protein